MLPWFRLLQYLISTDWLYKSHRQIARNWKLSILSSGWSWGWVKYSYILFLHTILSAAKFENSLSLTCNTFLLIPPHCIMGSKMTYLNCPTIVMENLSALHVHFATWLQIPIDLSIMPISADKWFNAWGRGSGKKTETALILGSCLKA